MFPLFSSSARWSGVLNWLPKRGDGWSERSMVEVLYGAHIVLRETVIRVSLFPFTNSFKPFQVAVF